MRVIAIASACPAVVLAQKGKESTIDQQLANIYNIHSGHAMDSAFRTVQVDANDTARYPALDNLRSFIASMFAWEKNVVKVEWYMSNLQYGPAKAGHYFKVSRAFENANEWVLAEKYARLSIDSAMPYIDKEKIEGEGITPASILASSLTLLTGFLDKQQRYSEAVDILTAKMQYCSKKNAAGLQRLQADMLLKSKRYEEALQVYVGLIKARAAGSAVESKMKEAYAALYDGKQRGFEAYLEEVKANIRKDFSDSIRKSSLKEKAPVFVLRNLEGTEVDLKQYQGKVVVLDFWATWCVPCKASFPAMQMAVDKYAADKNVVFLFIDTWEYTPQAPVAAIKEYLEKKNLRFNVLLDEKSPQTGNCEVVKKYGVDGVPAKFIIDKNGYIRFRLTGFNGTNEEAVTELSEMIELAAKG
ncbi:thiol:disulfide oxidoreductase related to ResA [Filimonas lacunae]|nr:thiol:disulfide oxidoreductase related to ResA [Filimonas lacunae]